MLKHQWRCPQERSTDGVELPAGFALSLTGNLWPHFGQVVVPSSEADAGQGSSAPQLGQRMRPTLELGRGRTVIIVHLLPLFTVAPRDPLRESRKSGIACNLVAACPSPIERTDPSFDIGRQAHADGTVSARMSRVHRRPPPRPRIPRMYAAWPTCCRPSAMTLMRRTPNVTGGIQPSSTIRSRSVSDTPWTYRSVMS